VTLDHSLLGCYLRSTNTVVLTNNSRLPQALIKAKILAESHSTVVHKRVRALVFLGTPHRGSAHSWMGVIWARVRCLVGFWASPSMVAALTQDRPELNEMHHLFEAALPHRTRVVNFYEKRKMVKLWGLFSYMVRYPCIGSGPH